MASTADGAEQPLLSRQVKEEAKRRKNVVARATESLDYEPVQNKLYYERLHAMEPATRKFYGYTGHTVIKNALFIVTGVITGCIAVALILFTRVLREWKNGMVQDLIETNGGDRGILMAWGFHWAYSTGLLLLAGCLVQFWAPAAAGAGVSLVMAYLNGNHVPNLLRFRTLVTKFIGTVCGCASSLAMGPEGPMVHLGACTASVLSHANPCRGSPLCDVVRPNKRNKQGGSICEVLEDLGTDQDHREFISAGTAAGLSAAFGAPIGGVLFSMEEACSHWSRRLAWRCFLAAVVAAFVLAQYNSFAHSLEEGDESPRFYRIHESMLSFDGIMPVSGIAWLRQSPFMIVVSLGAGLLGAIFNLLRKWLWNVRASRSAPLLRLLELVALATVSIGLMFWLSYKFGTCTGRNPKWLETYGMDWTCNSDVEAGQTRTHNDLATMFLSSPEETIRAFFSVGKAVDGTETFSHFTQTNLAIYCGTYIVLMALGSGLAVPGGLFMPAIMVGSSFGLLFGNELERLTPDEWEIQPGLYALIAATACLGGVFRSAISLVVIVVEGTRGIDYIFGVIIAVVCSNWVAHLVHHDGVYESEVEKDGNLCFLRPEPPHALHTKRASQVMSRSVVGVRGVESVRRVLHILRNCHHNGFPVVAPEHSGLIPALGGTEDIGRLDGLVLRSQLMVLLKERAFCDCEGRPLHDDEAGPEWEQRLEREMRMFFQRNYANHRSMATQQGLQEIAVALVSPPSLSPNGTPSTAMGGEVRSDGTAIAMPPPGLLSSPGSDVESGSEVTAVLPAGCPDLDSAEFQAAIRGLYIDVRPYMNHAPLTVHAMTAASRVHELFLALGMRHLCVVSSQNHVVGIITRKDLDRAAGHGSWRHAAMATVIREKVSSGFKGLSRAFSKASLQGESVSNRSSYS